MALIAFSEFRDRVSRIIWSEGEPENLTGTVRQYFVDCFIDLQRFIECLQESHIDIFPFNSGFFLCGLFCVDAPRGRIERVSTVQTDGFCSAIDLHPTNINELRCWSKCFASLVTAPANVGLPPLPLGFKYNEATTDSHWGRALTGKWAVEKKKLFVAPWLNSNESLVVRWSGIKRSYKDEDLLPDDADLMLAVRLFVQAAFARDLERDMQGAAVFAGQYREQYSDLAWECELERKQKRDQVCDTASFIQIGDLSVPEPDLTGVAVIAFVSDFGLAGSPQQQVAALVKSWDPDAVIGGGDCNYPNGEPDTIDANCGIYRKFIFPFQGTYPLQAGEEDATENIFFEALGNHDLSNTVGQPGQSVFSYFAAPGQNERYYDVVIGPVHVVVINSGLNNSNVNTEPDGVSSFSLQAEYVLQRLATSTSRWRVVCFHHAPYCSDILHSPGTPEMRWNWAAMNVDLVLCGHGHNFERIEKGNVLYEIAGTGGGELRGFSPTPDVDSKVRISEYGAVKIIGTCESLTIEFVDVAGVVLDSKVLT